MIPQIIVSIFNVKQSDSKMRPRLYQVDYVVLVGLGGESTPSQILLLKEGVN